MPTVPTAPRIYHITHVDNLAAIVAAGGLSSDSAMRAAGGPAAGIGMSGIKQRRLTLPVGCHTGDRVGDYVPFYFCPRSIMLYVIYRGNHPELTYTGGQEPIVHLEADLHRVVRWASQNGQRWAFSLSNAGAHYTEFRSALEDLRDVAWNAVEATDFTSQEVKEGKQAEFLVHGRFEWDLVERIGVHSPTIKARVQSALASAGHAPLVEVRPEWYY